MARLVNAFFTARRLCVLMEPFEHGELLSLLSPGRRGPLPEPLLSIVTRWAGGFCCGDFLASRGRMRCVRMRARQNA